MPRRRARFNISAPVVFRWKDRGGSYEKGDGVTRDIGIGGMFIVTNGPFPPENTSIRCEASLPAAGASLPGWQLRVSGRVQRATMFGQNTEAVGFAVRTRRLFLTHETHAVRVVVN
jgi:hypothetical protein